VPPFPPCESVGLIDLCAPARLITAGSWFTLQVPNLIWFLSLFALLVLGLVLPFPTEEVDLPAAGPGDRP
jgi:hypothetical protein